MAILVTEKTPVIVQGMSGRIGQFHTADMIDQGALPPFAGRVVHQPERREQDGGHEQGGEGRDHRHGIGLRPIVLGFGI